MGKISKIYIPLSIFFLIISSSFIYGEDTILDLSIRDADIRDVLQGIAIQNGINIVPDSTVTGNITINLRNTTLEEGLRILLESNGLEYEKQGNVYLVKKKVISAKSFDVTFQNGKLTINADNADIRQLLREISQKTGLNIVAETGLTGNVTANVSDISVDEAIYSILEPLGFVVEENNGIYAVKAGRLQQPQRGQGSFSISYRKDKLFIDVKNAPAVDVLTEIASKSKINLAVVGDVKGNITMRLDDVTLGKALDILTDASGNAYTIIDDTYMIGDPTVRPGQSNPILQSKVIWLKHMQAQDIINSLPTDIPRTNVTVSQDRNALIVLGPKKTIERLEGLLDELDIDNPDIRSRKQTAVSIEVDESGLLTVDAKDAAIEEIMREISIRKGIDITLLTAGGGTSLVSRARARRTTTSTAEQAQPAQVAPAQTQRVGTSRGGAFDGYVNFRITKATLEETFDSLFKGTGYAYKKETIGSKEIYIIGTGDLMPGGGNPLVVSKKIELHYLKAEDIMSILPLTVPDSNVITIEDQNAIMVMGTQGMIDEIESYIAQVDMPAPQIMIEALLVEIVRGDSRTLGVNWSWVKEKGKVDIAPGLSASFDSLANVPEKFIASLNAMISENKARILSAPRIATTSGMKASIKVGWTDYFETTTEIYTGGGSTTEPSSGYYPSYGGYTRRGFNTLESGITLDITPWVGASGDITVLIRPDIRDAKRISKEHSTIANRTMDTNVRVRNGENIVIGGLIQKNESATESRLPLLGSIPIVGHLFKKSDKMKNDTELIIIVRPKIIGSDMKEIDGE